MHPLLQRPLPDCALPSTTGATVNPARVAGRAVWFVYPYTGRPGVPDPHNWDHIPGAHGSTPQALGYHRLYTEFLARGVQVFGVSQLTLDWQMEFAQRNALAVPLLSDARGAFARALALPMFETGGQTFLRRITLLSDNGKISHLHDPVARPENDAEQSLVEMSSR